MAFPWLLAAQAGLMITSELIRRFSDDGRDRTVDHRERRQGSTTVAEEGTSPALVLGKARVRRTNVLMYEGPGTFQDYIRGRKFNDNFPFYRVDLQLGVCVRPLDNVVVRFARMWAGDTLITGGVNIGQIIRKPNIWGGFLNGGGVGIAPRELGADSGGNLAVSLGAANAQELSVGTNIVLGGPNASGDLTTDEHYGGAPGLCTIFLEDFQVGERPAMFGLSAEMVVWPDYTGTIESRVGNVSEEDANPAAALYQILTDDLIGIGLDPAVIDVASFNTAAVTLNTENHGFSIALDSTVTASEIIETIISQIDAALYTDPETQLITLKLIREDYGAFPYPGLDVFDDSNVLDVVQYKQTLWEDTYSQIRVEYEDREAAYAQRFAVDHDLASASSSGRLRSKDLKFPGVKNSRLANEIAVREMRYHSVPQTLVTLLVNRQANTLRPGDVFKWSNSEYGITDMILRVQNVDFGLLEQGAITLQCTKDTFANITTVFRDPDRHWLDDFGIRPQAPGCMVAVEAPPNPLFDEGGQNWQSGFLNTTLFLVSEPPPPPPSNGPLGLLTARYAIDTLGAPTVVAGDLSPVGNSTETTPCGTVGVAYSSNEGPYYDTATGLVVNLPDSSALRNSTEEEVRAGRAVALIGRSEYISYESFTDITPAPAFRDSSGVVTIFNVSTIIIPVPAGVQDGDLMVAVINSGPVPITSYPPGWTHVAGSPHFQDEVPTDNHFVVMTRVANGESGSYQWQRAAVNFTPMGGAIVAFENCEIDFVAIGGGDIDLPLGASALYTGGVNVSSAIYMTAIGVTGTFDNAGVSTILPTAGFTEREDVLFPAAGGHVQVQTGAAGAPGPVNIDINMNFDHGSEVLSFVTLGLKQASGGKFRLNNVWRGLFDTVAQDHPVADSVFFISDVDMGRITPQKSFGCEQNVTFRAQPRVKNVRQVAEASPIMREVAFTRRAKRAARPTQFRLTDGGNDAVAAVPEVNYAFNEDDTTALVDAHVVGADEKASTQNYGEVFTNDLRGTWNRRKRVINCAAVVSRGDDPDEEYGPKDNTRLIVEGKGDLQSDFQLLQRRDYTGRTDIVRKTEFASVAKMPSGPGKIRLCAVRPDNDTGDDLLSRHAEEIIVDMVSCRQLVHNRKFRPSWDLEADAAGRVFGNGVRVVGDAEKFARGWRDVSEDGATTKFTIPEFPLVQGADDEGFALEAEFTSTFTFAKVEQVFPVPYLDTEDSKAIIQAWVRTADSGEQRFHLQLDTLNAAGDVLDTTTFVGSMGATFEQWRRVERELSGISANVRSIRVTVGMDTNLLTTTSPSLTSVKVIMGPDLDVDQLTNGDFNPDLAGWTQTVGVWSSVASIGALEPVDQDFPRFLSAPAAGNGEIEQSVALPVAYGEGDYVRCEWWGANTAAQDTISLTLFCRDAVNAVISQVTVGGVAHEDLNQWYEHVNWLKIPPLCTNVLVRINAVAVAGGTANVAADQVNLSFVKSDARRTVFNWVRARTQPQPLNACEFVEACGDHRVIASHIFPLQDGNGVAPVDLVEGVALDVTDGTADQDFTFGAEAVGLYHPTNNDHISKLALELSSTSGGVRCSDATFLDPQGRSFGIYFQYRIMEGVAGIANILSKTQEHLNLGADQMGFALYYNQATHRLHFDVEVNSAAAGTFQVQSFASGVNDDGAWHWGYAKFNMTTKIVSIESDVHVGVAADAAPMLDALEAAGEVFENSTDPVFLGRNSAVAGTTYNQGPDRPIQLGYLAILRDEASEVFNKALGDAMWHHGKDQNELDTGYAISYSRTNRVAYPIDDTYVAMWAGSGGGGPVQVPLQYHDQFTGDDLVGLGTHGVVQNVVARPNDFEHADWTKVNAGILALRQVSERGVREMQVVQQTGVGGYAEKVFTGLTASTTYIVSYYATAVGSNHSAEVIVTQNDLSTSLVSDTNALTDGVRQRISFTFTTQVGQLQAAIRLHGGTTGSAGDATGYHGLTIIEGSELGPVIYGDVNQNGSLESTSAQTQHLDTDPNELTSADIMTARAICMPVGANIGVDRHIVAVHGAAGNNDARWMRIRFDGTQDAVTWDATGALVQNGPDHAALVSDNELIRTVRWRAKTNLEHGAFSLQDISNNPFTTQTAVGTYSTGAGHTRVFIACGESGGFQLNGPLQKLELFKGEAFNLNLP